MPLVNMNDLFPPSGAPDWAVGAFNVHNLEFIQAVIEAAEMKRAPVILAVAPMSIKFMGLEALGAAAIDAARRSRVPAAVHLDHARGLDSVETALNLGFTSIMYDGSSLPLAENIAHTRRAVEMAHAKNATAEGEIGMLSHMDRSGQAQLTRPEEAVRLVGETGVDFLAVSVGSVHGMRSQGARLDLTLLARLRETLNRPMVLHGSSGVVDEDMALAIQSGIDKVNIGTSLKVAFAKALQEMSCKGELKDPLDFLPLARDNVRGLVGRKIDLLNSAGKAEKTGCT